MPAWSQWAQLFLEQQVRPRRGIRGDRCTQEGMTQVSKTDALPLPPSGDCSWLPAASVSPEWAVGPRSPRGARAVKTGPAELGQPRLSHTSAQGGELEQAPGVGGPWCLVPGNHLRLRPPACHESCASQLMRAQAPVDNPWQDGKIEAQCLGNRRALLVSFLVEGAEARFLKPPRKQTEKRGCHDSQLRRTEPPGSPPHLSEPGW